MLPLRGQSGLGSDGNEGVLRIPQSLSMTETSSSNYIVSYQDTRFVVEAVLPLCREAVGVFYSSIGLGNDIPG